MAFNIVKQLVLLAVLTGGLISELLPVYSYAQGHVPAQANPGQIINQMNRDRWFQDKYDMWGPVYEEDYIPQDDAVIEFHDMDVNAEILQDNDNIKVVPAEEQ